MVVGFFAASGMAGANCSVMHVISAISGHHIETQIFFGPWFAAPFGELAVASTCGAGTGTGLCPGRLGSNPEGA